MKGFLIRTFVCILGFGFCLYSYIDKQNDVTKLRLEIPHVAKAIKEIREENTRLHYEIERFESPQHLMELARHSEFGHLKYPLAKEILTLQGGHVLEVAERGKAEAASARPKVSLAVGAKH